MRNTTSIKHYERRHPNVTTSLRQLSHAWQEHIYTYRHTCKPANQWFHRNYGTPEDNYCLETWIPTNPSLHPHPCSPDTSSPEAQSPKLTTPIVAGNPTHGRDGGDSGRETKESEPWNPKHPPEGSLPAVKERAMAVLLQVLSLCPHSCLESATSTLQRLLLDSSLITPFYPCLFLEQARQNKAYITSNINITFLRLDPLHQLLKTRVAFLS